MSVPKTQTAVQVVKFDAEKWMDNLKVQTDVPVPTPGQGEALVAVKLRPINPADVFAMMGVYPAFKPDNFPCVPGMEGMGVVVALGPGVAPGSGVNGIDVGTRVTAASWPGFVAGQGMYQEYVTIPADALVAVPEGVSDEAAACAVVNPVAALGLLEEVGPVPQDQALIITAAGSALGKMLISLCKDRGIKTIGTVRRKEQAQELTKIGCNHVVVTGEQDLVKSVVDITGGKGAYAAVDCLCGDAVAQLCNAVRMRGLVVLYGAMTNPTFTVSVAETLFRAARIHGYWMHLDLLHKSKEEHRQIMSTVFDLYKRGIIDHGAGDTVPLAKVVDAVKQHMQPGRPSKILLSSQ